MATGNRNRTPLGHVNYYAFFNRIEWVIILCGSILGLLYLAEVYDWIQRYWWIAFCAIYDQIHEMSFSSPTAMRQGIVLFLQSVLWMFSILALWKLVGRHPLVSMIKTETFLFFLRITSFFRSYYRFLTRDVRHDRYLSRLSSTHVASHPLNRLWSLLVQWYIKYNLRMQFIGIIVFGAIVIPALQHYLRLPDAPSQAVQSLGTVTVKDVTVGVVAEDESEANESAKTNVFAQVAPNRSVAVSSFREIAFLELLALGTVSTIVLLGLWAGFRFVITRQRHIVLRFDAPSDDSDLQAVAEILTHRFVEHIQRIGRLLTLRQVEPINVRLENPLALFVTSGQEEELIRQLGSLNDFEVSSVRFPLGNLLSMAVISLADTRVRVNGYVQTWTIAQAYNPLSEPKEAVEFTRIER